MMIDEALGWGAPSIWAGVWAYITVRWVRRCLREEKRAWLKE